MMMACAGSKKKRPSPHAQTATRVHAVISHLENRLNQRDADQLTVLLAPPLTDDEQFAKRLDELIASTSDLDVQFIIERLWIQDDETIRVDLHWTMHATLPTGPVTTAGTARFTMSGKDTLRLSSVSGDNPFAPRFDDPLMR